MAPRTAATGLLQGQELKSKSRLPKTWDSLPRLDRRAGVPVHVQIERWLAEAVAAGNVVSGDRLPSERELAALLGVSRMTLRQSLEGLERRGVISRVVGRDGGAFIAEPQVECDLTGLPGFSEQIRRANLRPGSIVLRTGETTADARVAAALELAASSPVWEIIRVRLANRVPLAIERSYFPARLFPRMLERDLAGSLYAVLADYGFRPHTGVEYLEPVVAEEIDARYLSISPGDPLTQIERTASSVAGVPVEYSRDLIRPDRVRIVVRSQLSADESTVMGALVGSD
jgi:GntR family transcriptional regulator